MSRISNEKTVVALMVRIYCRNHHGTAALCEECTELLTYAHARLDKCPFGDDKNTCRQCQIHCYRRDMAEKIRTVMRYSGPRMIFHHPVHAINHMLTELSHNKRKSKK